MRRDLMMNLEKSIEKYELADKVSTTKALPTSPLTGAPSYVQNLECTKMALQILNIQSLNIQNLECTTPWMYKNLNVQQLECTNLICTKP